MLAGTRISRGASPSGNQGFDVDAVIRTEGLFCQNDDWITHDPSLVALVSPCMVLSWRGSWRVPAGGPCRPRCVSAGGLECHGWGAVQSEWCHGILLAPPAGPVPHRNAPHGNPRAAVSAAVQAPSPEAGPAGSAKWAVGGIIGGSAAAGVLAAGSSALALYFARRVITPAKVRDADQEVLAVIRDGRTLQVILAATPEATVDGVYGFFFDGGRGHARIGRILSYSPAERTVLREVETVYSGDLSTARRGWWSGAAYPDPAAIGLSRGRRADRRRRRDGAGMAGPRPTGVGRHGPGRLGDHGARARRLAAGGPAGRPDRPGAGHVQPADLLPQRRPGSVSRDGRYGLGSTEWRDVEAAIDFALEQGAREVVLFGWSMGGAICLQTADLSRHRQLIRAMVLDAPVINWVNVLAHHAELNRIPSAVGRYGQLMLSHPLGRRLTGLAAPVDLKAMDWVSTGRGAADADPDCAQRRRRIRPVRALRRAGREESGDGHVRGLRPRPAHQGVERGSGALGALGHGVAPAAAGAPANPGDQEPAAGHSTPG